LEEAVAPEDLKVYMHLEAEAFGAWPGAESNRNVTEIVGELGIVKREVKCTQEGKFSHKLYRVSIVVVTMLRRLWCSVR
jgi:hypothetical protein